MTELDPRGGTSASLLTLTTCSTFVSARFPCLLKVSWLLNSNLNLLIHNVAQISFHLPRLHSVPTDLDTVCFITF